MDDILQLIAMVKSNLKYIYVALTLFDKNEIKLYCSPQDEIRLS